MVWRFVGVRKRLWEDKHFFIFSVNAPILVHILTSLFFSYLVLEYK